MSKDPSTEISIDTANIERLDNGVYLVWYEVRHSERRGTPDRPWNRQVIRNMIRCNPLSFTTIYSRSHVRLSASAPFGGGPRTLPDVRAPGEANIDF